MRSRTAKDEMRKWLGSALPADLAFCTLTYKQCLPTRDGLWWLSRGIMEQQTKWLLMRLDRALLGRRAKSLKLKRCVFHEGDGRDKRQHTHFVLQLPPGVTECRVRRLITSIWPASDWGRPLNDADPVYELSDLLRYLMKEGTDSVDVGNSELIRVPNKFDG
jgi:hypothetical protein